MAVTPEGSPEKGHLSQRSISRELGVSKGTVWNVLKKSDLKCYRKVKCQILTPALKESRQLKANALFERFQNEEWKSVWFSDEASFSLKPQLNRQNERFYRAVTLKTRRFGRRFACSKRQANDVSSLLRRGILAR